MSSAYPPSGEPLTRSCQRCGAVLPTRENWCRRCGYLNMPKTASAQPAIPARTAFASPLQRSQAEQLLKKRQHIPGQQRSYTAVILASIALLVALLASTTVALYLARNSQGNGSKAKSSTQTPAALATPNTTPLFADQFENNNVGWNVQGVPGMFSVSVGGGSLVLEDSHHSLLWEAVPGQGAGRSYSDLKLFVDAALSQGDQDNGYGVFIRGTMDQNNIDLSTFYRFSLYGDGTYAIFKGTQSSDGMIHNQILVSYTSNPIIQKAGKVNHIVVEANGASLMFAVNGLILSTVTDKSYASGLAGLFVDNLTDSKTNAQATFSHLAIYPAR
jgi:hypothetical protein